MKFSELLLHSFQRSEIPLRFEPGAEEALAKPVIQLLKAWLLVHEPDGRRSDFERGQEFLILQLIEELEDRADVPE